MYAKELKSMNNIQDRPDPFISIYPHAAIITLDCRQYELIRTSNKQPHRYAVPDHKKKLKSKRFFTIWDLLDKTYQFFIKTADVALGLSPPVRLRFTVS